MTTSAGLRRERATQVLLVLACAGLAGLLIEAGAEHEAPGLTGRDVGRAAPRDIKAIRSFDYSPGAKALDAARDATGRDVLPVYDYAVGRETEILGRIHHAFTSMRESPARAQPAETRRLRFAALLGVPVSAETFAALDRRAFPVEMRAALADLVGSTLEHMVVADPSDLPGGIVVRHLGGGSIAREQTIRDFGLIVGLDEARVTLKARVETHYAGLGADLRDALAEAGTTLLVSTLSANPAETARRQARARAALAPRPVSYVRGQVIVREGDVVTDEHVATIEAMSAQPAPRAMRAVLATTLLVALLVGVILIFAVQRVGSLFVRPRDLLATGFLLLGFIGLARGAAVLWEPRAHGAPLYVFALPMAAGAMLVRMTLGARGAALFAFTLGVLGALAVRGPVDLAAYYVVTGIAGASGVARVQSRRAVLRAGLLTGLVASAACVILTLRGGEIAGAREWASLLGLGMLNGMLAALLTTGLLPIVELLGYTTDVTLLELANLNHPLLRELVLRAPGTYHHSMVVGSLAETACDRIGANGLLARVAAYFHDLGKAKNAGYFAENFEQPESPHGRLRPSMSALIIRNHVKDTSDILREHRVPEIVVQTATQHHGTTLIEYFHHKAAHKAAEKSGDEEVREQDYRYAGPKPQTREAGVLMLADGVEAAARSLADTGEDRLNEVVQRVINKKFSDGQLDECDLTLRDLHAIARSFLQVLRGIYHQRPAYPWQEQQRTRERRKTQPGGEREVPDARETPGPTPRPAAVDWDVTEENAAEGRGSLRRLGRG